MIGKMICYECDWEIAVPDYTTNDTHFLATKLKEHQAATGHQNNEATLQDWVKRQDELRNL
jgi:hypothetical protein